jgi:hypothetical protein
MDMKIYLSLTSCHSAKTQVMMTRAAMWDIGKDAGHGRDDP